MVCLSAVATSQYDVETTQDCKKGSGLTCVRVLPGDKNDGSHRPHVLHVLVHALAAARILVLVCTQECIHTLCNLLQCRCGRACGHGYLIRTFNTFIGPFSSDGGIYVLIAADTQEGIAVQTLLKNR